MSNYDKIAQRAYELWEKSGRPEGKETEHWFQAEAEINRNQTPRSLMNGSSSSSQAQNRDDRRGRREVAV
jgi:Protein of unknown function (DUF2934)